MPTMRNVDFALLYFRAMLIFGDSTACIKTALDVKCPFMMAFVTSGKLKAELWDFQFTLGHFLRVLFCFRAKGCP